MENECNNEAVCVLSNYFVTFIVQYFIFALNNHLFYTKSYEVFIDVFAGFDRYSELPERDYR